MNLNSKLLSALGAVVLIGCGLMLPDWMSYIMIIAFAKGLVVLGLVLLMRAGLVSFGQALYYCIGAYVAGLLSKSFGLTEAPILIVAAAAACVVIAAVIGLLLCRYREIFFAMFTMAFSMILFGLLVRSEAMGSTDGFHVVAPSMLGWTPEGAAARDMMFVFAAVLVIGLGFLAWRLTSSPTGFAAEAVRENEIRVEYLGGSVFRIVYTKYLIAAGLAGVGGCLTALTTGHVDPEMAFWTTSGEFVFIALMGGTAHVAAPLIAALLFELLRTYAFAASPYTWQMILGVTLLLIILFLPKGLWSLTDRLKAKKA